jgi:hypothetical protein
MAAFQRAAVSSRKARTLHFGTAKAWPLAESLKQCFECRACFLTWCTLEVSPLYSGLIKQNCERLQLFLAIWLGRYPDTDSTRELQLAPRQSLSALAAAASDPVEAAGAVSATASGNVYSFTLSQLVCSGAVGVRLQAEGVSSGMLLQVSMQWSIGWLKPHPVLGKLRVMRGSCSASCLNLLLPFDCISFCSGCCCCFVLGQENGMTAGVDGVVTQEDSHV